MTASIPRLKAPKGTCDTHIHFYGAGYRIAPTALVKPTPATVEAYREMTRRLGIERTVVVQPTTYGMDNTCTLDGIAALGRDKARGIAVVDTDVSDAELRRLTEGGMRGIRFFALPGGALPWEKFDALAARVQSVGWHVQLQLDGRLLPEREAQIRRWPGRIVIDHQGKFLEPVPNDHPAFRSLLRLVETGRVWVKLAAPYETSKLGPPYFDDVGRLAKELVKAAPERMLWASNWPHPSVEQKPDDAVLLDMLLDWAPDPAIRQRILVDNPAALYGF
ncbi:MAG TPA: amidohydrolase family protein [Stellaceae bacterium]|nr:amidohydrolase family protein [Stellaceae bacterium]